MAKQTSKKQTSTPTRSRKKAGERTSTERGKPSTELKKPSTMARPKMLYTMSGELEVLTAPAPPVVSETKGPYRTSDIVVDEDANVFSKAALTISLNGKPLVRLMDAEQVELLLKLVGMVSYGEPGDP